MYCDVNWCSEPPLEYKNGRLKRYCEKHSEYSKWVKNAPERMWLFYKLEKILKNLLICEGCGFNAKLLYRGEKEKTLVALYDVDHIDSLTKNTVEGEHPDNYQLLCKNCHAVKSINEGDFISKCNR